MDERVDAAPFFWMEEYNGQRLAPVTMKRKVRPKKLEFVGWGSKSLVEFLESIGKDTSKQISQFDVTDIINKYVYENNLFHPSKKKRILCDERLHYLFGRKTISRIKIYDMLETHYAENQEELDDDFVYSSEEEENVLATCELQKTFSSERKTYRKRKVLETPKSCYAAITPDNIKLVFLRRSLVQDLLKDPETFEGKLVGSFVRIKADPNDYLQKNSHQLLQVTGIKKATGIDSTSTKTLLQVANFIKDINISMLSDDNFSEKECEDLHQRVKDGLLKRLTVVELEEKARILHEDITKHWLVGELALLQKLVDRANEKGWRKELFEYLERRQLLQNPDEQSRLLREVPKVIADEVDSDLVYTPRDFPDDVKRGNDLSISVFSGVSKFPIVDSTADRTSSTCIPIVTDSAENQHNVLQEQQKQPTEIVSENNGETLLVNEEDKASLGFGQRKEGFQDVIDRKVIDLSDDEENEDPSGNLIFNNHLGSLIWHYADPQGDVQGPFSIISLKRWRDADYFPTDFKVWRTGQSQNEAVLLINILHGIFPN